MNRCDKLRKFFSYDEIVYITSYPNIFYYSGFTSPDAVLIITKCAQLLFTDSRYTIQAHIQAPDFEIIDIGDIDKTIRSLKEKTLCFEEDSVTVAKYERLKNSGKTLKPFASIIKKPRMVKDKYEMGKIAQAEQLGDQAFGYIINRITPGRSEKEIALELEFFMRKNGASALSFETICASGVRSAMPHGTASDKIIEKGDLLTMDFGCILDGYCSDMTRTVVIGKADEKQKEIYDIVLRAQLAVIDILKAGIKCSDADMAARKIITECGYGKNFGHSTGHSVGIEIHELPVLSPKSGDVLEAGNVVSVEPGIYIEDFGGVRIEDLVQITSEKQVNLTKSEKNLLII